MLNNKVMSALSSPFPAIPDSTIIFPVLTRKVATTYLHFVSVGGAILGRVTMPSDMSMKKVMFQRSGSNLYVFIEGLSNFYRINLSNFGVSTLSTASSSNPARTWWTRISDTKCIHIDTQNSRWHELDMPTGIITSTGSYIAATAPSAFVGTQAICSFYSRGSSGLNSFGSRIYWHSGETSSSPNSGEINTATYVAGSLSARTISLSSLSNYSRWWGSVGNSTTGIIRSFGDTFYKTLNSSNSATSWFLSSNTFTYNSNTYNAVFDSRSNSGPMMCNSNLLVYATAFATVAASTYRNVLCVFDFSQATNTQTPAFVYDFGLSSAMLTPLSSFIYQKNTAGDVVLLVQHPSNVNIFNLVEISGSTVVSTIPVDFTTTYSDQHVYNHSAPNSELGVYL